MPLLFALLLSGSVPGSVAIDPKLSWYTFETVHFAVHFPCRGRLTASATELPLEIAWVAEEVHAALASRARWTPRGRTQVVVADFFDAANAWAAPLPENTITIIPTEPRADRTGYGSWLRSLFAHEYAHIVQADAVTGAMAGLRRVFGRAVVPNALMPIWLHEGYAVDYEGRLAGFGRADGTEYDMMLRAAARAGRLLPIDRWNHYELESHPGGLAPYLYGSRFMTDFATGLDQAWDRFGLRSAGLLPFVTDLSFRQEFGQDLATAVDTWRARVTADAEQVETRLASASRLTQPRPLTASGWSTGSACWSRAGERMFYVSATGQRYPAIRTAATDGSDDRVLIEARIRGQLSPSPDGRWLAFGRSDIQGNYYDFSDVWLLELATGRTRRLTHGLRACDPDFDPASDRIVCVASGGGGARLLAVDLRSGAVDTMVSEPGRTAYHGPRFSPDGRYLAYGIHRPDGSADIELLDTGSGWKIPVTQDRANDLNPCWSRTGRYLFFVSDRTGVYNLYAWRLRGERLYRCTNVSYGVFEPAVAPDNRTIALTAYSADGFDLATVPLDPAEWVPADTRIDTASELAGPPKRCTTELYYYNPSRSLLPRLWLPYILPGSGLSVGALTLAWDPLQYHRYVAAAGWRFAGSVSSPFLDLGYSNSRLRCRATLSAHAALDTQRFGVDLILPWYQTRRVSRAGVGWSVEHHQDAAGWFRFGLLTSTAVRYRYGAGPAEGAVVTVTGDYQDPAALSRSRRLRVFHRIDRYFGFVENRASLHASLQFGVALGDSSVATAWRIVPGPASAGVRGFRRESEPGRSILLAGAEIRMPIAWPERGHGTVPLFLSSVDVAVFLESGMIGPHLIPRPGDSALARIGTGTELRTGIVLGHRLPVSVKLGGAIGVDLPNAFDWQLYLGVESSLLAGLLRRPDDPVGNWLTTCADWVSPD